MDIQTGLRAELVPPYAALDVVASTGSTNVDLREAAAGGAADRTVLIADEQTAGLGRHARSWQSPPGSGLYCSVLFRPAGVPAPRLGALTLLAGIALVRTARALGVDAEVKWPNDLLVPELGKCAGVLAESVASGDGQAVVLGMGLNIAQVSDVPPGAGNLPATSLQAAGATDTDRQRIAARLLGELAELESTWREAAGDLAVTGLLAAYREVCGTVGREVRVEMASGTITGTAVDVDDTGQLLLDVPGEGVRVVSAGDVVHLRPQKA
jgi:BirA family biotin operon repressor/biotin-[acetyl-CoA-carboxylase] ligase